jgi:ribulose-phosphate 3-epimerase
MSVEPGFGGQKFMTSSIQKLRWLSKLKKDRGLKYLISIDGGINLKTIEEAKKAGAEIFVAGSAIFGAPNRSEAIKKLEEAAK